ncbi:MAG TPA: hypothetical protein DEG92_09955 [Rikenellaceae bacterium]|nr:hypothetical protein [Rikenellaceae bacterium]
MAKYGTIIWVGILAVVAAFLIVPDTNEMFKQATGAHPYIMGFFKFALLSIMGEFLANRLVYKKWVKVKGLLPKMLVWGVLGMMIVLMFSLYTQGVHGAIAKGLLWAGNSANDGISAKGILSIGSQNISIAIGAEPSFWSRLLTAFYISAIMNLTFGAVFMAAHRITDTYIDSVYDRDSVVTERNQAVDENRQGKVIDRQRPTISGVISTIDWTGFLKFVVGKTIPLFWIPAHTITFMLPDQYKVLFAASLSIVLGLILSYAKLRVVPNEQNVPS